MAAKFPSDYDEPRRQDYDVPNSQLLKGIDWDVVTWEQMFQIEETDDEQQPRRDNAESIYARVSKNKKKRSDIPLVNNSLFGDFEQNYAAPIWPPLLAPEGPDRSRAPRIKIDENFSSNSEDDGVKSITCNAQHARKTSDEDASHIYEDISNVSSEPNICISCPTVENIQVSKQKMKPSSNKILTQAARIKELSGSLWNVLNISDYDASHSRKQPKEVPKLAVPISIFKTQREKCFKRACTLYFEGGMAVGKSTLIQYIQSSLGIDTVITFPEPMYYWTEVYNNVLKKIYKANKHWKPAKDSVSAELLSCQLKFAAPLKSMWTYTNRCMNPESELVPVAPLDNWVVFDRHMLSACIVFPSLLLNKGMLSFGDFMHILGTFQATVGDTIVLLTLGVQENYRRIKRRARKYEEFVDMHYLKDVRGAFNTAYYAWLFLQYFSIEEVLKVCTKVTTLKDICSARGNVATETALKIWSSSLFATLEEVIEPFNHSCTLIETCSHFCHELYKLQFVVIDVSEFNNDVEGAWSSIYMQTLKNPDIKTRSLDWTALKNLSRESYQLQTFVK
ncbi:thymidine kinase [Bovine gammaherpesvirus 6]|uniref:Thymidine kinase n=1 Tax=Bovine gammaherpesvirus 6 TaxID=1504288 RepID=A0A060CY10_9GAMA|nr:thymidine kinase [Bovine gammaherpesvirus 6]AIB03176.1 thymidine kinase [Bovine gammaherpesvirus 6]